MEGDIGPKESTQGEKADSRLKSSLNSEGSSHLRQKETGGKIKKFIDQGLFERRECMEEEKTIKTNGKNQKSWRNAKTK